MAEFEPKEVCRPSRRKKRFWFQVSFRFRFLSRSVGFLLQLGLRCWLPFSLQLASSSQWLADWPAGDRQIWAALTRKIRRLRRADRQADIQGDDNNLDFESTDQILNDVLNRISSIKHDVMP